MSNPTTTETDLTEQVGPPTNRVTLALQHVVSDLGKNGIFIALVAVVLLFTITTNGILLRPQNISNLIVQNGYILVLAIGMVLVIVAGHIDLSVGSVAAFIGAVSGVFAVQLGPAVVAGDHPVARGRSAGRRLAGVLDRLRRHPGVHRDAGRHAHLPRARARGARQPEHRLVPGGVPRARQRLHQLPDRDRACGRTSTR